MVFALLLLSGASGLRLICAVAFEAAPSVDGLLFTVVCRCSFVLELLRSDEASWLAEEICCGAAVGAGISHVSPRPSSHGATEALVMIVIVCAAMRYAVKLVLARFLGWVGSRELR